METMYDENGKEEKKDPFAHPSTIAVAVASARAYPYIRAKISKVRNLPLLLAPIFLLVGNL
jgi:hypothetical protein